MHDSNEDKVGNWHVISYPRSGNHAVRSLIEYASERPTMPSLEDNGLDIPIYLREPNQVSKVIDIKDSNPIGYKAHSLLEFMQNDSRTDLPSGLILITRDPVSAIVSHLYPEYEKNKLKIKRNPFLPLTRKKIYRGNTWWIQRSRIEVNNYLGSIYAYLSWKGKPRIHLRFEELMSNPVDFANSISSQMHLNRVLDEDEVTRVLSLSKSSLQRKAGRTRDPELVSQLSSMVSQFVDYEKVLNMIDGD